MTRRQSKARPDSAAIPTQPQEKTQEKAIIHQSYQGPIPPSLELERYEQVLPGAAERILAMAEREQASRHDREDLETRTNIKLAHNGQRIQLFGMVCALIITAACIGAAVYFADSSSWLAGVVFTSTISVLALAFVYDRKGSQKE